MGVSDSKLRVLAVFFIYDSEFQHEELEVEFCLQHKLRPDQRMAPRVEVAKLAASLEKLRVDSEPRFKALTSNTLDVVHLADVLWLNEQFDASSVRYLILGSHSTANDHETLALACLFKDGVLTRDAQKSTADVVAIDFGHALTKHDLKPGEKRCIEKIVHQEVWDSCYVSAVGPILRAIQHCADELLPASTPILTRGHGAGWPPPERLDRSSSRDRRLITDLESALMRARRLDSKVLVGEVRAEIDATRRLRTTTPAQRSRLDDLLKDLDADS